VIRDVVLHINNEQPLLADLFDRPAPGDTLLVCTNLRTLSGTRPIWIDETASTFYFPYGIVRFVEIHQGSDGAPELPPGSAAAAQPAAAPEPEPELDIDEDFLRRVREA
jgi:hypothetical protein